MIHVPGKIHVAQTTCSTFPTKIVTFAVTSHAMKRGHKWHRFRGLHNMCQTTCFCCLPQGGTMAQSHRYKENVDHINFSSRQGDTCKHPDTKGGLHIYLVSKFAANMQLGLRDWELICDLRGHAVCKHYSLPVTQ